MKTSNCIAVLFLVAATGSLEAQRGVLVFPPTNATAPLPPRVWVDPNYQPPDWSGSRVQPPAVGQVSVYDQKAYGGHVALITPEQSQQIIERFRVAYPKLGSPRFLIYVNRELVPGQSGLKPTFSQQHIESTRNFGGNGASDSTSIKTTTDQSFHANETAPASLADRQTVRDVERIFCRPLRQAGATIVDQKVAAQLMADKPIAEFVGTTDTPESRKDREAISKIADVVIEILISSKTIVVPTIADAQTVTIPDLQATAISLKESKIMGQSASSEVLGRVPPAALGSYGVPEITDATALALMDDLAAEAK